jgi:hypothetical protein
MSTLPKKLAMPPELATRAEEDIGKGVSFDPADQTLPLLSVLQTNSPACDRRGADYIDGAKPGDFLLRGAADPIRDGETGIITIPCGIRRAYLEWLPNRQGFVARHEQRPDDFAVELRGSRRIYMRSSTGNIIEEARELYLLVDDHPCLMSCRATQLQFARDLNTYIGQFLLSNGGVAPSFARKYKLTTAQTSNSLGSWFRPRFCDLGWVADEKEYRAAKALNARIERGTAWDDSSGDSVIK